MECFGFYSDWTLLTIKSVHTRIEECFFFNWFCLQNSLWNMIQYNHQLPFLSFCKKTNNKIIFYPKTFSVLQNTLFFNWSDIKLNNNFDVQQGGWTSRNRLALEVSCNSVDLQKILQNLQEMMCQFISMESYFLAFWETHLLLLKIAKKVQFWEQFLNRGEEQLCLLTISEVVPIFLASSLRSIVLRYRYLFKSSPSKMFRTGFCSVRRSACNILSTWDTKVNTLNIAPSDTHG